MNIGRSYELVEFFVWTRRKLYVLAALSTAPVLLYQAAGQKWVAIPWAVAALLGTATSFIVGFKNAQTYSRTLEAQQVCASIVASSRFWGLLCRDFTNEALAARSLIYRHLAWLAVLRHQLRGTRVWENAASRYNAEYLAKCFSLPDRDSELATELEKYLAPQEIAQVEATPDKAWWLMNLQSAALREMLKNQGLVVAHHGEMQKTLKDLIDQQSRLERIKNYPYPRQYEIINTIFVWCFAALLPFGLLRDFDRLNEAAAGLLIGHMVWFTIPFSLLVSWLYLSLNQVGQSTENPFEGGANDVPVASICRSIEIELRQTLGETALPPPLQPHNRILM